MLFKLTSSPFKNNVLFIVRHSSEYKASDSDRKVNRNIYPDAVTRDRMHLIDPKSGQLEPIHHCCLVEEL